MFRREMGIYPGRNAFKGAQRPLGGVVGESRAIDWTRRLSSATLGLFVAFVAFKSSAETESGGGDGGPKARRAGCGEGGGVSRAPPRAGKVCVIGRDQISQQDP